MRKSLQSNCHLSKSPTTIRIRSLMQTITISEDYTGDLRKRLKSYGITHGSLAREMGALESQVSRWFNKDMQPSIANVFKIEAAVVAIRKRKGIAVRDTAAAPEIIAPPLATTQRPPTQPAPNASPRASRVQDRLLLTQREANVALSLAPESQWLDHAPIPWVDMRKPGASRPVKRWRVVELEKFISARRVEPGYESHHR